MKRAEVWRDSPGIWWVDFFDTPKDPSRRPLQESDNIHRVGCLDRLTHAEALAAALEQVGLTEKSTEKEN